MGLPARRDVSDETRLTYTVAARDLQAIEQFRYFCFFAWSIVFPGRVLVWNWHLNLVCDEVQDFTRTLWDPEAPDPPTQEMVVCVPPRSLKSYIIAICLQAWLWLHAPWTTVQGISHNESLANEHARKMLELIISTWYARLRYTAHVMRGGDPDEKIPWKMSRRQAATANFANTIGGERGAFGVNTGIIGKGGDLQFADDPYDAKEAVLGTPEAITRKMGIIVTDYDSVWRQRLNDPIRSLRFTIMQRLDPLDLAGELLRRGKARRLVLPMEFDPEFPDELGGVHPLDPRTEPGQLLMERRWSRAHWEELLALPGSAGRHVQSQYNQRPTLKEGGLFKRHFFDRRYPEDPQFLRVDLIEIDLDCAFTDTATSSWVCMQAWGKRGDGSFFLLDQVRDHLDYVRTCEALLRFTLKWYRYSLVHIENKANGPAVISLLKSLVRLIEWEPGSRSKYERAEIGSKPSLEAGQVYYPSDHYAPWMPGFIERHVAFDGKSSVPDDEIDCESMQLLRWTNKGPSPLEELRRQLPSTIGKR